MNFSDYFFMPLDEIGEDDLETVDRCGCCGAKNAFQKIGVFREKPAIHFVRCRRCRAVTYDRMLREEKLNEVYENYSYLNEDRKNRSEDQITFHGKERFARHVSRMIRQLPPGDELRVLDFGGGDGSLCCALCEQLLKRKAYRRIEIVVVDYADRPCVSERSEITIRHCFPLRAVEDKPFDLVIASAVLEHLPKPGREFLQLVNRTADGGYLYFRTPYKYPLYRLMKRFGITLDMRYPRHIWDLGSDWWDAIPVCLKVENQLDLIQAGPSIVEKTFRDHFLMALGAHLLKAPGRVTRAWRYVGGWETMYRKRNRQTGGRA